MAGSTKKKKKSRYPWCGTFFETMVHHNGPNPFTFVRERERERSHTGHEVDRVEWFRLPYPTVTLTPIPLEPSLVENNQDETYSNRAPCLYQAFGVFLAYVWYFLSLCFAFHKSPISEAMEMGWAVPFTCSSRRGVGVAFLLAPLFSSPPAIGIDSKGPTSHGRPWEWLVFWSLLLPRVRFVSFA